MIKQGKLGWLIVTIMIVGSIRSVAQDLLISGGNTVSTIICANGNVYTWGSNVSGTVTGILGNGSGSATVMSPALVTFPEAGVTVKAVDAGSGAHFIALDCNGGGWSWENNGGPIGITATGSTADGVITPTRVLKGQTPGGAGVLSTKLVDVKYISGGNDNSYAILNTGEAIGWGLNSSG